MEDKDIQQFKTMLEEERDRLTQELESIASPNPKIPGDWSAKYPKFEEGENVENPDISESADEVEEYEVRRATEQSLEHRLKAVTDALARIDARTYGISIKSGNPLPIAQLRANPAAESEVE